MTPAMGTSKDIVLHEHALELVGTAVHQRRLRPIGRVLPREGGEKTLLNLSSGIKSASYAKRVCALP
jgi:hypothetical protein